MSYDKLVRDRIPEIIISTKEEPITHIADDVEYEKRLKDKLQEEVDEFLENPSKKELVDILEVVYALSDFYKITKIELEIARAQKEKTNGGFKKRIILDDVKK
jgi:predicted house-cleaning noncanonical NTP pyrophosphatase (MazG superfamily)